METISVFAETGAMDLKVQELLKEVQLDDLSPTAMAINRLVSSVTAAIEAIPDQDVTSDAAPGFVRDLGVPPEKACFTFKRPDSIHLSGSHSFGAVTLPDVQADLLVCMPKECFHEKDYLNHRYHSKRCLYLCVLEKALRFSPIIRKTEWSTFQGESRKPILILYPVMERDVPFELSIRIMPVAASVFDVRRLSFVRNNVRVFSQGDVCQPTPIYNCSILEDMFLLENAEFIEKVFSDWKNLQAALVILKVWARQRSSIYAHDCLNGYLMAVVLSYLATESGGKRISKPMNAMQIFRITLKFFATSNSWEKDYSLCSEGHRKLSKQDSDTYKLLFGALLFDASGYVNLAFRMRRSAISELQDEASWTLACLEKCHDGAFEQVFMTKIDFAAKFDYFLRINLKENDNFHLSGFCLDIECWRKYEDDIYSLLQRGLNDRAKLVRVFWRNAPSDWRIEEGFLKFVEKPVLVGIMYNSEDRSFRVVDVGPNAEDKEKAVQFRKFWGEKSELRRFKDGAIAESTLWECQKWERHLVVKRIVEFILSKHLHLPAENMIHIADQLDFCLCLGSKDAADLFSSDMFSVFEVISKRLRLLDDIPLRVSSVQPLDPAFRHTSVFPPLPNPLAHEKYDYRKLPKFVPTCVQPLEIVIQLEGSGNWPLDDLSIQKTKCAFLIRIAESLWDRWGMTYVATEEAVDVLTSGYAFRLKILHERGLNILKNQTGNIKIKHALSIDRELFLRSQHSSMINGIHGRYPTYGPVVRLAKRWVSSHLFSSYFAEEAIELIVAYLFLNPFPFSRPCSRITGFLRFLRILSNYDWNYSPMIIDINEDLSLADKREINEFFILSRKSSEENFHHVEATMFLATPYDKHSDAWTKSTPNKQVLKRISAYAQSSSNLLTNLIHHGQHGSYTWECIFHTPLNNYDAVILFHRDQLPYPRRRLFPTEISEGRNVVKGRVGKEFHPYIELSKTPDCLDAAKDRLMVDFDPIRCLLHDLKKEFPSRFDLWYDSLGGDAIGLTWETDGSKKRKREDSSKVTADLVNVLKGVGEAGKGLIRSVYLLKTPRCIS